MAKYLKKTHYTDGTVQEEVVDWEGYDEEYYSYNVKMIEDVCFLEAFKINSEPPNRIPNVQEDNKE